MVIGGLLKMNNDLFPEGFELTEIRNPSNELKISVQTPQKTTQKIPRKFPEN